MRRFSLMFLTCLLLPVIVQAAPDLVLMGDLRLVDSFGSVTDVSGQTTNGSDVAVPPQSFATPFDDTTALMLDVEGAFFHAQSDQQSMISVSQLAAIGSTSLDLWATEAASAADGNTCTRYTIAFQANRSFDYTLSGTIEAAYAEESNAAWSWTRVRLVRAGDDLVNEGVVDSPGILEVASEGVLAPGSCTLLVESHSLGSVVAGLSGSATTAYDITLELSLLADFNTDGHVNAMDLAMLLGSWGRLPGLRA